MTRWKPSPWQRSQAPWGELKEKIRGSSSGIEVPQFRQANFSEKSICSPSPPPSSIISTSTRPAPSAAAASTDSESRRRRSGFITSRSTTIEMSCLYFLSSTISSSRRRSSPLTLAREYPSSRICSSSFPYSPLRPRTTGAMSRKRWPASRVIRRSLICSRDWPAIGSPHVGQCGIPIRDQSRRR